MYPVHGLLCNTRTFPFNCMYCGSEVFFFSCDHGSRVLFDSLGSPWPRHQCGGSESWSDLLQDEINTIRALKDIHFNVREPGYDLLAGLQKGTESISQDVVDRASSSKLVVRNTVRMEPIGSKTERILGLVSHISSVDIGDKFNIERNSVVATEVIRQFGGLQVEQLTILVDEYLTDPDAVDSMSYTVWRPVVGTTRPITAGQIVQATIRPAKLLGVRGFWLAITLERL